MEDWYYKLLMIAIGITVIAMSLSVLAMAIAMFQN